MLVSSFKPVQESLDKNVFNKLTVRYILALSAIAVAISLSEFMIQNYIKRQLSDSRVINVAGRQRMLSQKLTKEALLIQHCEYCKKLAIAHKMDSTVSLWKKSHIGLQYGSNELELPGDNSLLIKEMFNKIEPHYQAIITNAESLTQIIKKNEDLSKIDTLIQNILFNEPAFLEGMNNIVFQYDKEAKFKVQELIDIEILLYFIALGILLFELLFIFRPTAIYSKKIIAHLIESQEREKRMGKKMLEKKSQEQLLMSELIFEGQERERRRVSRDLHDGIGQLLTGLKFQIEAIETTATYEFKDKVETIKNITGDIIKEVRRVSFNLRPTVLSDYGLPPVLKNFVQEINKITDVEISFKNPTEFSGRLGKKREANLYRIAQEAINNALKYAKASKIEISVTHDEEAFNLVITDDGIGFTEAEVSQPNIKMKSGHGLYNMKERANLMNAEFDILSSTDEGTEISVRLPFSEITVDEDEKK